MSGFCTSEQSVIQGLCRVGFVFDPGGPKFSCTPCTPVAYGRHVVYYALSSRGRSRWATHWSGSLAVVNEVGRIAPGFDREAIVAIRPDIREPYTFGTLLLEAATTMRRRIVVKNVSLEDAAALISAGLRSYGIDEYWSAGCRYDDQTFPDVVMEIVDDQCDRSYDGRHRLVRETPSELRAEAKALYTRWLSWYLRRYPSCDAESLIGFYETMFGREVFESAELCFAMRQAQDLTGVCVGSLIGVDQVDLWIALTKPEPRRSSVDMFRLVGRALAREGVRYIGLGGSEERGLHRFKLGLGPCRLFERTHLVAEPLAVR